MDPARMATSVMVDRAGHVLKAASSRSRLEWLLGGALSARVAEFLPLQQVSKIRSRLPQTW